MTHPAGETDATTSAASITVFVAFALVPLYPPLSLALLGAWLVIVTARRGLPRAGCGRRTAVVIGALVLLGVTSQLANWITTPLPASLAEPPIPASAVGGNLLAAHDVSWLRVWTRENRLGAFAEPVEGTFWRLPARDPTGAQVSEAIAELEVSKEANRSYTIAVVLRHDGTRVEATLLERTREGRQPLPTTQAAIGPGLVRLHATIPPSEVPTRLRSLHLVDLGGDWTSLDVGWPSLTEGDALLPYAPRTSVPSWPAGVAWWLGLGTVLLAWPVALQAAVSLGGRAWIVRGLLAGLAVQAVIAVNQAWVAVGAPAARASGTLLEANVLAHAVLVSALTATAVSPRPLRIGPPTLILAAVTIAASGSRSGTLGLALGALALALALARAHGKNQRALGGLVVAAVITSAAVLALGGRADVRWSDDANLHARAQIWQASMQVLTEHPLWGVGHERLALHYEFWQPPESGPLYRNNHAHNAWLALATGFGLPTAIVFTLACMGLAWHTWRSRAPAALAVLGVALVINLVDLTLFHPSLFLPVWTACCLRPPSVVAS